jgi:hypothetical protein
MKLGLGFEAKLGNDSPTNPVESLKLLPTL